MQYVTSIDEFDLTKGEYGFVLEAMALGDRLGEDSLLLLTGSKAAGYSHMWSDLDLWLLGDKAGLWPEEAMVYEGRQVLFIPSRDIDAHVSFYDYADLEHRLASWPMEIIWILHHATAISGDDMHFVEIKTHTNPIPDDIVESYLQQAIGAFWMILQEADLQRSPFTGLRRLVDLFSRICCLAERTPYPYLKRREQAAWETTLGKDLLTQVYEASRMTSEINKPPDEPGLQLCISVKALKHIAAHLTAQLKNMGWSGPWLDDPVIAMSYAFAGEQEA